MTAPVSKFFLVICVFVLELVQTVTSTHQAWWYTVTNWNNQPALLDFPWSAMTIPTMSGIGKPLTTLMHAGLINDSCYGCSIFLCLV